MSFPFAGRNGAAPSRGFSSPCREEKRKTENLFRLGKKIRLEEGRKVIGEKGRKEGESLLKKGFRFRPRNVFYSQNKTFLFGKVETSPTETISTPKRSAAGSFSRDETRG